MTNEINESQRKALRSAGVLYLMMALTAPVGLLYVPGVVMVPGDMTATADNIRNSESLLRFGLASELFHQAIAVFLVMALYRLFKPVDENQARLLVALGALVSVPIMFVNVLNEVAALMFASGADFLSGFDGRQLDALAFLFYRLHEEGINVAAVFWGLWLFPFGILVIRSGFIPRLLGILLLIAGSAYVIASFTSLVLPQYSDAVGQVAFIFEVGELPIVFWFVFKGLRPRAPTVPARDA
jgi:hypothetical protein